MSEYQVIANLNKLARCEGQAVARLRQLRDLADYQKTRSEFNLRLGELRLCIQSRVSFVQRLKRVGLARKSLFPYLAPAVPVYAYATQTAPETV